MQGGIEGTPLGRALARRALLPHCICRADDISRVVLRDAFMEVATLVLRQVFAGGGYLCLRCRSTVIAVEAHTFWYEIVSRMCHRNKSVSGFRGNQAAGNRRSCVRNIGPATALCGDAQSCCASRASPAPLSTSTAITTGHYLLALAGWPAGLHAGFTSSRALPRGQSSCAFCTGLSPAHNSHTSAAGDTGE